MYVPHFLAHKARLASSLLLLLLSITASQKLTARSEKWKTQKIAAIYQSYFQEFAEVPSLTIGELQQLEQHNDVVLVDVRTHEERAVSMIPGAISRTKFEQKISKYKNQVIVVYCTIAYRSGKYAQKLRQRGLNIFNLEGSLLAWSHFGGDLENNAGKTKQIYVFGNIKELIAEDYQAVW